MLTRIFSQCIHTQSALNTNSNKIYISANESRHFNQMISKFSSMVIGGDTNTKSIENMTYTYKSYNALDTRFPNSISASQSLFIFGLRTATAQCEKSYIFDKMIKQTPAAHESALKSHSNELNAQHSIFSAMMHTLYRDYDSS